MLYLKISDVVFSLDYSNYDSIEQDTFINTYLYKYLLDYICESNKSRYSVKFNRDDKYIEKGKFVSTFILYHLYRSNDTVRYAFGQEDPDFSMRYIYTADISNDWNKVEFIDYIKYEDRLSEKFILNMFSGLYCYIQGVLLRHNSFFVHGVALQYKGKGLIFSAASGVGKTTHTNFWAENFGAEILNGDTPVIKLVDRMPFIYGSPWCGTSDISVNKAVPLDAVIIISRGTENKIRKLSKFEAVSYFFPHIKRPAWDAESVNLALDHCETLINTISVYKLECLPNSDAAEVARRGILELNEH